LKQTADLKEQQGSLLDLKKQIAASATKIDEQGKALKSQGEKSSQLEKDIGSNKQGVSET